VTGPAEPAPENKAPVQKAPDKHDEVQEVPSQDTASQVKASNEAIPADKAQFQEAKGSLAVMTTGDAQTQTNDKKVLGEDFEIVGADPTQKTAKTTADGSGGTNGDKSPTSKE